MPQTSRRHFIQKLGLFGLGFCARNGSIVLAGSGTTSELPGPQTTGVLTPSDKDGMWQIFNHIGKLWQSSRYCMLTRTDFDVILDLKTSRPPSYLTAYRGALTRLRSLSGNFGAEKALNKLFSGGEDESLRRHVLAELIELQLANGGFRVFGYENYRGFMGGSFSDKEKPPYRLRKQA